jgi:hypothetical protein
MVSSRPRDWSRAIGGGVVAGLVGGGVLAVYMLIVNLATGQDPWLALKGPATPFLHERARQAGFDAGPVFLGALTHFGISAIWGLLFGALFYGASRRATPWLGLLWGLAVWIGMYYVVLPIAGLGEMARTTPIGRAVFTHLLFGLFVGLTFTAYQPRILPPAPPVVPPVPPREPRERREGDPPIPVG